MSVTPEILGFYHLIFEGSATETEPSTKLSKASKKTNELSLPVTQLLQSAAEAQQYDIQGFCVYIEAYANGQTSAKIFNDALKKLPEGFTLSACWVNQVWERSYQQAIKPESSPLDYKKFIALIAPSLCNSQYQRFNNAPFIVIYNPSLLQNIKEVTDYWRTYCKQQGIAQIHIAAIEHRDPLNLFDTGIDSFVEFPVNRYGLKNKKPKKDDDDEELDFKATLYDYERLVTQSLARPQSPYQTHRGVLVGWDDTSYRGRSGFTFKNTTVANYKAWLYGLIQSEVENQAGQSLIFIHAWNDERNSAALNSDQSKCYDYLDATQQAINGSVDWPFLIEYAQKLGKLEGNSLQQYLAELTNCFQTQQKIIEYQAKVQKTKLQHFIQRVIFTETPPEQLRKGQLKLDGEGYLDKVNSRSPAGLREICVSREALVKLEGWAMLEGAQLDAKTNSYFVLDGANKQRYFAFLHGRLLREDVSDAKPGIPKAETLFCGFAFHADWSKVPSGIYRLGIMQANGDAQVVTFFDKVFNLV